MVVPRIETPHGAVAPPWFGALLALVLIPGIVCELGVALFNQPKFVVPPHLRTDSGLLGARGRRPGDGSD